jgi:hypothetical protein
MPVTYPIGLIVSDHRPVFVFASRQDYPLLLFAMRDNQPTI